MTYRLSKIGVMAVLLVALISLGADALAGFWSGNTLMPGVRARERILQGNPSADDYNHAFVFRGYVVGVADTSTLSCLPKGTSVDQIESVVIKFMNSNPERWELPGEALVSIALANAFPCKK